MKLLLYSSQAHFQDPFWSSTNKSELFIYQLVSWGVPSTAAATVWLCQLIHQLIFWLVSWQLLTFSEQQLYLLPLGFYVWRVCSGGEGLFLWRFWVFRLHPHIHNPVNMLACWAQTCAILIKIQCKKLEIRFVIYDATWFTKWNHFHDSFPFPHSYCINHEGSCKSGCCHLLDDSLTQPQCANVYTESQSFWAVDLHSRVN